MRKCDTSTPREVSSHSSTWRKANGIIVDDVVDEVDGDVDVVDRLEMAARREGKIVLSLDGVRGMETELILKKTYLSFI
jgi:hypothetical protein